MSFLSMDRPQEPVYVTRVAVDVTCSTTHANAQPTALAMSKTKRNASYTCVGSGVGSGVGTEVGVKRGLLGLGFIPSASWHVGGWRTWHGLLGKGR